MEQFLFQDVIVQQILWEMGMNYGLLEVIKEI